MEYKWNRVTGRIDEQEGRQGGGSRMVNGRQRVAGRQAGVLYGGRIWTGESTVSRW